MRQVVPPDSCRRCCLDAPRPQGVEHPAVGEGLVRADHVRASCLAITTVLMIMIMKMIIIIISPIISRITVIEITQVIIIIIVRNND